MKFWLPWRHLFSCLAALFLFSLVASAAQFKPIHLRNQTPLKGLEPAIQTNGPRSGLFLVQFSKAPGAEQRAQLAGLGVDLLHYVPEDTFLGRFQNVRIEQLRALPFVQWIGQYRPEHKIHKSLQSAASSQALAETLRVTILLVPHARASEIAETRGLLVTVQQESTLRSGTVLRGKINPARLAALANSDAVLWIEPALKYHWIARSD